MKTCFLVVVLALALISCASAQVGGMQSLMMMSMLDTPDMRTLMMCQMCMRNPGANIMTCSMMGMCGN
ncbi:hypothetical protein KP79_PYT21316 [Mizuhopecten yessoensis]|uniref:Uncharacterized protein n=1 Tax=Mizuhopecten yessoensis TaxID=6573 RepID=A0A210PL13_MIZYE|nr:hypothetical protein KP79_PYT21316 [Mizuhopecten yessoensis]